MKYGDAIDATRPGLAMQRKLFEDILFPITGEPLKQFMEYFCHQAYEAWQYKVNSNDLSNVNFVEQICAELYLKHKVEFLELANAVLEDQSNVADILHESEKRYYEADNDGNDARLKSALDHYKTFFESALRLWSSIPYFYAVRVLGIKTEAKLAKDFLRVSSGEKFQCLRARKVHLKKGRLSDLVDVFSNQLRNAGGGHDSYEFLDDGRVLLHISNPKSGKTKTATYTFDDIKEEIDKERKAIWVLRNGFMTYLNKNPKVLGEISRTKPLKIREIKSILEHDAYDLLFKLVDFTFDEKNKMAHLKIVKRKYIGGRSTQILFGNGDRYDIVTIATEVKLEEQLFGMVQRAEYFMHNHYQLEKLSLVFTDEEETTHEAIFGADVVSQSSKKDKTLPNPLSGALPIGTYDMHSPVTVPYGLGKVMETEMRLRGYRVIS